MHRSCMQLVNGVWPTVYINYCIGVKTHMQLGFIAKYFNNTFFSVLGW